MSKASPSLPYGTLDLLVLRTLVGGPRHANGILLQIHEASSNLLRMRKDCCIRRFIVSRTGVC